MSKVNVKLCVCVPCVRARKNKKLNPLDNAWRVAEAIKPYKKGQESFYTITLNSKLEKIETHLVSLGSLVASIVTLSIVFRPAVLDGAYGIVCVHNHPSGDLVPSAEDKNVAVLLRKCGELLQIPMVDFVICDGVGGVYSFVMEGKKI